MPFKNSDKEEALVRSRRCCCVCHVFAGLYTNVHHIVPEHQGGSDDLENAIVLCLRCHGEAGHYNVKHPIGNKYSPNELRRHRDEWWEWCENNPNEPLPKDPISISPGVIDLGVGKWKAYSFFKIYNRTNEIFYQIFVKLTLDNLDIIPRNIRIDLATQDYQLAVDIGRIIWYSDIWRIDGIDQSGNKAIFLWLASINPKDVCTFALINESPGEISTELKPRAFIGICGFNGEPAPILHQSGKKAAVKFKSPEDIKVESIGVLIKRPE